MSADLSSPGSAGVSYVTHSEEPGAEEPLIKLLAFQQEAFWSAHRELWLCCRRQAGKSFLFGCKALSWMMLAPGDAVFIINASLLMGRENILKETEVFMSVLEAYTKIVERAGMQLSLHEVDYTALGRDQREHLRRESAPIPDMDVATMAGLFEANALEARIWHSRTQYSRSRVVAANPATARGYTGHKLVDEAGFIADYEALDDAIEAISARNPRFNTWRATTPPLDASHPVFAELCPAADKVWVPCARGNWYETPDGIPVLRVDAHDAELAGILMYGRKGREPISIEAAREQARNKAHFDRNYLLKFVAGGMAAVPRHLLINAQCLVPEGCGLALDLGEIGDVRGAAAA